MSYPEWIYFPNYAAPPAWVQTVVDVFAECESSMDSREHTGIKSDDALEILCPGLESAGFQVETGKKAHQKILRPVLFAKAASPRSRTRSMHSSRPKEL